MIFNDYLTTVNSNTKKKNKRYISHQMPCEWSISPVWPWLYDLDTPELLFCINFTHSSYISCKMSLLSKIRAPKKQTPHLNSSFPFSFLKGEREREWEREINMVVQVYICGKVLFLQKKGISGFNLHNWCTWMSLDWVTELHKG